MAAVAGDLKHDQTGSDPAQVADALYPDHIPHHMASMINYLRWPLSVVVIVGYGAVQVAHAWKGEAPPDNLPGGVTLAISGTAAYLSDASLSVPNAMGDEPNKAPIWTASPLVITLK
jgi:hypothetical protein